MGVAFILALLGAKGIKCIILSDYGRAAGGQEREGSRFAILAYGFGSHKF